jgi:hypothetical protein
MIIIANGREFPTVWFGSVEANKTIMFGIIDARPLSEIARDFEYALRIEKKSETEGNEIYVDNGRVLSILRPDAAKDNVQITVERGAKLENID